MQVHTLGQPPPPKQKNYIHTDCVCRCSKENSKSAGLQEEEEARLSWHTGDPPAN